MLYLLVSLLLLHHLFSLFLENHVFLLAHLRVPQYAVFYEVIGLE